MQDLCQILGRNYGDMKAQDATKAIGYQENENAIEKEKQKEKAAEGKREKKRTAIIRDLICVDLVGVFFGVAVAVGLWQHSFWLGLVTWIVPSFVSIFYTAEKDDDLTS